MIIIIYVILPLVLSHWFCIVGFEIDEFVISEILLFIYVILSMSMLYQYICISEWWHDYVYDIFISLQKMNWLMKLNIIISWIWKERELWFGLALSCGIACQELMPGSAPTGLYVEEYDPRKIMKNLIRERSWMIWSEKDNGHYDPRKIMNISIRGRSQKSIRIKDRRMILVVQSQSQS